MKSLATLVYGTLFGLSLALASAGPAEAGAGTELLAPATGGAPVMLVAQADIDFGDDTGDWANDGECDDPRFEGPGAADILVDADLMKDATDCRTAYEAGTISLAGAETGATAQVDFGDDSSDWANDGECDDPRFEGTGMAVELLDADIMKDATDCRTLFEAGSIRLVNAGGASGTEPGVADIDFGDDSSEWANDGECDDPRFEGTGMAVELVDADLMKDATDCRTLYEAGSITLAGAETGAAAQVDFGDDTSKWANDGECDDPRFTGTGMAAELVDADLMKDATDCRTLYEAGSITLRSPGAADTAADIDFGDDTSTWANDGECDDPRFTGPGAAATLLDEDMMHDASDCRAAYEAGSVTLQGSQTGTAAGFYFGDDSSQWANDGECDDLRFTGAGTDKKLLPEDEARDATDCRTLLEAGSVEIRKVYDPAYAAGAPYESSGIDFGDNTSTYANDGECDDPRFEGPGTAMTLLDSDELHDANDCRTAYEAGTVVLREG